MVIWFCLYLSTARLNSPFFYLYLRAWLTQSNLDIKIAAREFFKIIIFCLTVLNRHFCSYHFPAKLYASFLWLHFWVDYNHIYHISQHCRCSFFFCCLIADLRLLFKKFYKSRTLQIRWHICRTWSLKISPEKQQRRNKICWVSAEDYERRQ